MLKNILNTFATRLSSSVLNLVLAIFISNLYGAGIRGEQSLVLTTITIITLFTAIVGSSSILFLTPRRKANHLMIPSYIWTLLICLLVYIILLNTSILGHEYVLPVCLLTIILSFSHINASLLMGIEKIKQSNNVILLNSFCVLGFLILFTLGLKIDMIEAYLFALFAGYSASLLLSSYFVLKFWKPNFSKINVVSSYRFAFTDLLRYGFLNQLDLIASLLSFRLSYYFIDYFLGKGSLGVYSNAISIIESIWLISRSIAMVQNARIANSKDLEYSARITTQLFKISFVIVLGVVVVLLFIPANFYQFLFGDEFGEVRKVMIYISPGILFFSISFIISGLFSGTGKYVYNTLSSSAGLVVTVITALVLIPRFGLVGAAFSATLAYIVSTGARLFFLLRKYPVTFDQLIPRFSDFQHFREYLFRKKEKGR